MIQYLKVQLFLQDSWSLIKSIYVNNSDGIIMAAIIMINQPSGFRSVLFGCDMGFARKIRIRHHTKHVRPGEFTFRDVVEFYQEIFQHFVDD